jgi:nitroimidazol reductase NimA-like FMN-containing flavoprotein (pyridoxamine 5'-phosphate oxidase superfamily)
MSVRLSTEEAWSVIEGSQKGIFTTLRKDGSPVALPVWFVVIDRTIYIGAPTRTKKITRVRNDPRASFLVESGLRWAELQAVHLNGLAAVVDDPELKVRIREALDSKYEQMRTASDLMPTATRDHYSMTTYLRLEPQDEPLSWNNRNLGIM